MKNHISIFSTLFLSIGFMVFIGCSEDPDSVDLTSKPGTAEIRFENIVGNGINLSLSDVGNTTYPFKNKMDQEFNVTLLKYLISEIVLEGPNGERFVDPQVVTADEALGFYLINQQEVNSMFISLEDVPAGVYNSLSFTIGVKEEIVQEGAAGGVLSQVAGPADADMFWNWNSGYQAMKFEGQSPANDSGYAFGESVGETDPFGFAFHIGGWGNPNNNKSVKIDIDPITINASENPEIHLVMDVYELLGHQFTVDFSTMFNIHSPTAGEQVANNIPDAFKFDHIHQ